MIRQYGWWVLFLTYAVLIFYLSSKSNPLPPSAIHLWDKAEHFIEYLIFGLLLALALGRDLLQKKPSFFAFLVIGFTSLYGASDEFHQMFVPGRDANLLDWIADTTGGGAAFFFYLLGFFSQKRPSNLKS